MLLRWHVVFGKTTVVITYNQDNSDYYCYLKSVLFLILKSGDGRTDDICAKIVWSLLAVIVIVDRPSGSINITCCSSLLALCGNVHEAREKQRGLREREKEERNRRKVLLSSMIPSARPTVSPVAITILTWDLFCFRDRLFEKWEQTPRVKIVITAGRPRGSKRELREKKVLFLYSYFFFLCLKRRETHFHCSISLE